MKKRIIIDTDIGTDVDDAIALSYLIKQNKHKIVGIATVGGNTQLRANIARTFLTQLSSADIPIQCGANESLNGVKGYISGVEATNYQIQTYQKTNKQSIAEWYEEKLLRAGKTSILAIGALTNIATALRAKPNLETKIETIYIMGGIDEAAFANKIRKPNVQSHNVKEDLTAANYIFNTNIPLVILQKDIPLQHPYTITEFKAAYHGKSEIGDLLYAHAEEMITFSKRNSVCLYDPILAAVIGEPRLYRADEIPNTKVIRELNFDPKSTIEKMILR